MKKIKILLSVACASIAFGSSAQDFSLPQYAKWGDTPENRKENILANSYLGESVNNREYNQAAGYFQHLIEQAPTGSINIYINGGKLYKAKINAAKDPAQKRVFIDSLMTVYDLRMKHFPVYRNKKGMDLGTAYVLDIKARDMAVYLPMENALVRETFRAAIEAGGDQTKPDLVVAYFADLCDDYKNTDEVLADEVIAEYDRLSAFFAKNPMAVDEKKQFETAFGLSGAASCDNLEKLYKDRLAAAPADADLYAQAVALMARAHCDSDFFIATTEHYYELKHLSETAMLLAEVFQKKGDFSDASKYLNEALESETDTAQRQKLLVRIAFLELVSNKMSGAASAARQARDLDPEDGVPYFVLAQCYASSAAVCDGFSGQAAYWVAYDTMAQAIELMQNNEEDAKAYLSTAKQQLSVYRSHFPTNEELFFNEVKEGTRYTVGCGLASGIPTVARAR